MKHIVSKRRQWPLMFSLLAHAILLLCLLGVFRAHQVSQENLPSRSMQAHLATSVQVAKAAPVPHPVDHTSPNASVHRVTVPLANKMPIKNHQQATIPTIKANSNQAATPASTALTEKQASQLSRYLHRRIAMHAHFPLDAPEQDQGRSTLVSMMLYPDGHVDRLVVSQSSGLSVIDESALSAVTTAMPFDQASRWIQHPMTITFRVRFKR